MSALLLSQKGGVIKKVWDLSVVRQTILYLECFCFPLNNMINSGARNLLYLRQDFFTVGAVVEEDFEWGKDKAV